MISDECLDDISMRREGVKEGLVAQAPKVHFHHFHHYDHHDHHDHLHIHDHHYHNNHHQIEVDIAIPLCENSASVETSSDTRGVTTPSQTLDPIS